VSIGRCAKRVPANQDGSRPFRFMQSYEKIREADDRAPPLFPRRLIDFGRPWYARWAKESPSTTSSGRLMRSASRLRARAVTMHGVVSVASAFAFDGVRRRGLRAVTIIGGFKDMAGIAARTVGAVNRTLLWTQSRRPRGRLRAVGA
jgi:hypothetical protein